ncbi:MAG: LON peptidase substrate-binding domain-containing protein [Pseudomonadales bacterium]|nr:LON peptidase substrate-binding domain-containing protein [Pseudomonadales bacterium]
MIEPAATGGEELALFPLRSVLLPGARMALQIFEPRYLDLVSHCMKSDCGFGIVRITAGHELILVQGSEPPATASVGTLARIVDWDALAGGRLRITVEGGRRFRVASRRREPDLLMYGDIDWLPDAAALPLSDDFVHLQDIMCGLAEHPALSRLGVSGAQPDSAHLAYALAQYLPLDEDDRYAVLLEQDPLRGLEFLDRIVRDLGGMS